MPPVRPARDPHDILSLLFLKIGLRVAFISLIVASPLCCRYLNEAEPVSAADPAPPPEADAPGPATPHAPGDAEAHTAFTVDASTRSVAKAEQAWLARDADEARQILEEARRLGGRFESTIAALKADD